MRAGQIQLYSIGHGRQLAGNRDKFLDRSTENRDQQETIVGDVELAQAAQCLLDTRISQTDGVDKATWCELAVNRLAIAQPGRQANTFRRNDPDFWHGIHHALNDGRGCGDDAGGDRKGP